MNDDLKRLGEFGLIRTLTQSLRSGSGVAHGIGDDCAVVEVGGKKLLLTCDASLEGVHFHRDWGAPADIGWKAAVSALSDIAAMGGKASFVLVTLALPNDVEVDFARALYQGLADAVESASAAIVGGDTTASRSGIVIDITVVGEVVGRPVLRNGARPGDLIAVTGIPGRRGAGLHALLSGIDAPDLIRDYLHPVPRIAEGQWLQAQAGVHALIDVSDGILPDARHLAGESGVGIDLRAPTMLPDAELDAFWRAQGREAAQERLRSGEEYELLAAIAPEGAEALCASFQETFGLPFTVVGVCVKAPGDVRVDGVTPVQPGFEHFR
jgi:thiamine-monophosphate kinase